MSFTPSVEHLLPRLGLFLLAFLLSGCTTSKKTQLPPEESHAYHVIVSQTLPIPEKGTFMLSTKLFKVHPDAVLDITAADKRIMNAIRKTLTEKGFAEVKSAEMQPDISIGYAVSLDSSLTAEEINQAHASEFPIRFPQMSDEENHKGDLRYHEGMLVIDVIDNKNHTLLWRGAVKGSINMEVSKEIKDKRVQSAIDFLFSHYPRHSVR